jgi:signal peptidase II
VQTLHRRVLVLLFGLALGVLVLDQLTKFIVVKTMIEGQTIVLIPGVAQFIFVRNPGAAFSFAGGQTWIFSILAVAVAVGLVWVAPRIRSRAWAVVFGLLLGGTLGNLGDRLFREPGFGRGHVVDFIDLPWLMPAIFNVADIAITTSAVMFIILIFMGVGLDGKRAERTKPTPSTS